MVSRVNAQTFTPLYGYFARPMTLIGNTLYAVGDGVYALNTEEAGFLTLHNFLPIPTFPLPETNSGGAFPNLLISSGNTLYGATELGGEGGDGTLFTISADGTGFASLYSFTMPDPNTSTNSDGGSPNALVLSGGTLYGTTLGGGNSGNGVVFAISTNGTGFTTLYNFTAAYNGTIPVGIGNGQPGTNSDGVAPNALIMSAETLFGAASAGGSFGEGTVFRLRADGTGFRVLHTFTGFPDDGGNPSGLVLSGTTLYGTTDEGGTWNAGTVFAVNTDGTGFRVLYSFNSTSDGWQPTQSPAGLVVSGGMLYGTRAQGGSSGSPGNGNGTVFAISTDGARFTVLYNFTRGGSYPYGNLVLSGGMLYGFAGLVYSLSLPPQLTITPAGANVILSWPTNSTGFILQSAADLSSQVWTTNLPTPVVVNGQYAVTNPISGTQQFFRLSQ
jgi:uncharacterized repeat protein (TIGR03803 family)